MKVVSRGRAEGEGGSFGEALQRKLKFEEESLIKMMWAGTRSKELKSTATEKDGISPVM